MDIKLKQMLLILNEYLKLKLIIQKPLEIKEELETSEKTFKTQATNSRFRQFRLIELPKTGSS